MADAADDPWTRVRTAHDLNADEVVSAFQKSIRRGLLENAMLLAYEMYSTSPELEEHLWARLSVISAEDVGSGSFLEPVVVNAYHHQGVRAADLAPGLVASAWADSSAGALVEGLETAGPRFVVGVQCHPERTDSTPAQFESVFEAFVAAAR